MTQQFSSLADAVLWIVQCAGPSLRVAMPLGIGKPNPLINALYQYCKTRPEHPLSIFTALSLLKPQGQSELEQRFLQPLVQRLYGNYPDLDYARDMRDGTLPAHIDVHEFFLKSGDWLHHPAAQQHFISSNYTHIARDIAEKNPNLLFQALAARVVNGTLHLSLSCNPDITLDLIDILKKQAKDCLLVGMINPQLPFMPGSAEIPLDLFDVIIDDPVCSHTLFCTPNMAVSLADHAIGLHASSLVRDGGTLQIGIGSLGDAIAHALLLRESKNERYREILRALNHLMFPSHIQAETFHTGLYGCSEMLVNGLLKLLQAGIIKRAVKDNQGRTVALHGGFFIGPQDFYESLRLMQDEQLSLIDMQRISFINQLYGDESGKRAHRQKASFINTCMMATLGGAAISDGLENGQVVSGVGGQYNFVAMAHELEDAQSILILRSTRKTRDGLQSNIVTHYGHCTIPRHLRDIVITEYGIAWLRGKNDADVAAALICIADSQFQEGLREWAVAQGKLPEQWKVPPHARDNTPDALKNTLRTYKKDMPDFPFGHDFTEDELVIVRALQKMKNLQGQPLELLGATVKALFSDDANVPTRYLQRMGFDESDTLKTRLLRRLFSGNL